MITTLDGAVAGMLPPIEFVKSATPTLVAGRPHSMWYLPGIPGAGAAPTPGIGGAALSAPVIGQLPWTNPASGNSYLARLQAQITVAGTLLLCDRLWHNSGLDVTLTTEQVFTSAVQIPARDADGTNAGRSVYAGVEVSAATGAGVPVMTLKYTNQAGTAGQTATNIQAAVATSAVGAFYQIGLAAGDTGIQKPQSLTLNATWTSGTIHVILYRILARLELQAQTPNAIDGFSGGFPKIANDAVPFLLFIPNTTTASLLNGHAIISQG